MKNEKIEYYTIKPNLKQLFGRKVTKKLYFDEYTEDKKVHQKLKNCVLTTFIRNEQETSLNGIKDKLITTEETKIVQKIPVGTILIWNEESGYIIPSLQMTTLEELKKDIKDIEGVYKSLNQESVKNESKRNESENV